MKFRDYYEVMGVPPDELLFHFAGVRRIRTVVHLQLDFFIFCSLAGPCFIE